MSSELSTPQSLAHLKEQGSQLKDLVVLAQSFMTNIQSLTTNIHELTSHGERIADDVVSLRESVKVQSSQNEEILKRVARLESTRSMSSNNDNRLHKFLVNYLMRVGMDTRFGFMCAVPVSYEGGLYIAISLNLLTGTVATFFPNRKDDKTMAKFRDTIESVLDGKKTIIKLAQQVMAIHENDVKAPEARKWVVLKAEAFLDMCETYRTEDVWDGTEKLKMKLEDPSGVNFDFRKMCNFAHEDEYSDDGHKMRWGESMSDELLATPAMREYRAMVIDKWMLNVRNGDSIHFTAHDVFGERVRMGKTAMPSSVGKKQPPSPTVHGKSPRVGKRKLNESESGSDSESDSDSESEDLTCNASEKEVLDYATKLKECSGETTTTSLVKRRRV